MYLLHTQLCAWEIATRHHHNVRSALVLEGIGDSARITNGSSTVSRTQSMVELPIHVGSRTLVRADRTG